MDNTELQVEEFSGERFPDLGTAQRLALPALAACLEPVIRELISKGELIVENGKIIPNPEKGNSKKG
jgi:hypothetical protein